MLNPAWLAAMQSPPSLPQQMGRAYIRASLASASMDINKLA
jgi:hypothetical protein